MGRKLLVKPPKGYTKDRRTRMLRLKKVTGRPPELKMDVVRELRFNSEESHKDAAKRLGVPYHMVYRARFGDSYEWLKDPPPWLIYKDSQGSRVEIRAPGFVLIDGVKQK